jgi:hypothetical protein
MLVTCRSTDVKGAVYRSSFFCKVTRLSLVVFTEVSGKTIFLISKGWGVFLDCLTLESDKDILSRNVGNKLPANTAQHFRSENLNFTAVEA